jgi:hypothetical protein
MTEIRRIREHEAATVTELWDRMCRETPDGGPLSARGRCSIERMLAILSWHRDTFCLAAADDDEITGFVLGRVDDGGGLLPCRVGEVQETYARDGRVRRRLVETAIARLRTGRRHVPERVRQGRRRGPRAARGARVRGRHDHHAALRHGRKRR